MTGPEHFREAERLIELAKDVSKPIGAEAFKAEIADNPEQTMRVIESAIRMSNSLLAEAQVHATLALAAAQLTALPVSAVAS